MYNELIEEYHGQRTSDFDDVGRLTPERLAAVGLPTEADYYLCGPSSFMADLNAALTAAGVAPERLHSELFGSRQVLASGVVATDRPPPHQPAGDPGTGPVVSFARSGLSVPWAPEHGSLLELAEACDVPVRWSCRTGVCHTCETALMSGTVSYSPDPIDDPAEGSVLICCSQPSADLVLDL